MYSLMANMKNGNSYAKYYVSQVQIYRQKSLAGIKFLKEAANEGVPEAVNGLSSLYQDSRLPYYNLSQSIYWKLKALENQYPNAYGVFGILLSRGYAHNKQRNYTNFISLDKDLAEEYFLHGCVRNDLHIIPYFILKLWSESKSKNEPLIKSLIIHQYKQNRRYSNLFYGLYNLGYRPNGGRYLRVDEIRDKKEGICALRVLQRKYPSTKRFKDIFQLVLKETKLEKYNQTLTCL